MLSTSRVYSVTHLSSLPLEVTGIRFSPSTTALSCTGMSAEGISEDFPSESPLSLYGAAKRASEVIILDYSSAFDFPAHVNRCGMLAGAGQFGKPDHGIFSYWLQTFRWKLPPRYIGFGGTGYQVRDCLHPHDLSALIAKQITSGRSGNVRNVSGGWSSSVSLAELTAWCSSRWGRREVTAAGDARTYDVPWLVLDSSRTMSEWNWEPERKLPDILEEIAAHVEANPDWLELSDDC